MCIDDGFLDFDTNVTVEGRFLGVCSGVWWVVWGAREALGETVGKEL